MLLARLEEISDGDFQRMSTLEPAEFRNELFTVIQIGRNGPNIRPRNRSMRRAVMTPIKVVGWSCC